VAVLVGQNTPEIHAAINEIANRYHLDVAAKATGYGDEAPDALPSLGSASFVQLHLPEIAFIAEHPINAHSFGWAWFTLSRQYEVPVSVLRAGMLETTPIQRFNVIVLPEVSGRDLARLIGDEGIDRLRRWVRDGGTLVTLGSATDFAREELGLIGLRSWYDTPEGRGAAPVSVSEIFVPATLHHVQYHRQMRVPTGYLSAGYAQESLPVHVASSRLYLPPQGRAAQNAHVVATYAPVPQERIAAGGSRWADQVERLPGHVFAYHERVGHGRVVAFAEDPNFRAQWRGANRMFLNAVILSPSAR
jgi:hypothetical protein